MTWFAILRRLFPEASALRTRDTAKAGAGNPRRPIRLRFSLAFAAVTLVAGCNSVEIRDGQVVASETLMATWDHGYLFAAKDCYYVRLGHPDTRTKCLDTPPQGVTGKVPAVVFLHGCAGWNSRQYAVMETINSNGYIVFAPDSFARPGRVRHCGQVFKSGIIGQRLAEVELAVAKIRQLPWVDPHRLVLAGFSEGGIVASAYSGNDFRGVLVLGWGCGRQQVSAPRSVSVLNVVGAHDDESSTGSALCAVGSRPHSRAVNVNAGHDVSGDPETARIIGDFMRSVL